MQEWKSKENGAFMIEASIVMTITMVILGILVTLGSLIYQKHYLQVAANDTAISIARVYPDLNVDPFIGYVNVKEMAETNIFRSTFNLKGHRESNVKKGKWYTFYKLSKYNILAGEEPEISVNIGFKEYDLFVNRVEVRIKQKYNMPLVKFFGLNPELTFEAVGYADCIDIVDYISAVDLTALGVKNIEKIGIDDIGSASENLKKALDFAKKHLSK